jgi:hypothetical protein
VGKSPPLRTLPRPVQEWILDAYRAGRTADLIVADVDRVYGAHYHPGTVTHWAQTNGVRFMGDTRAPVAPIPEPQAAKPKTADQRILELTGAIADRLGQPRPETWHDAEQILSLQRLPRESEVCFVTSDWQGMFRDPLAMDTRAQMIALLQPNAIYLAGDILDAYVLSRFMKNPELEETMSLGDEVASINGELDRDQKLSPRSRLYFKAGNHEAHLPRYLAEKAPALRSLGTDLTVPGLLKAAERRMEYREYQGPASRPFDFYGLKIQHGAFTSTTVGANSVTAKAMRKWPHSSGVLGHSHRAEVSLHYSEGRLIQWFNCGCLAYLTPGMDYFEGSPDGWAHAALTCWYVEGKLHCQLSVFQEHCAIVGNYYVTPSGAFVL